MPKRRTKQSLQSGDSSSTTTTKKARNSQRGDTKPGNTQQDTNTGSINSNGNQNKGPFTFESPTETFAQLIQPVVAETFLSDFWEKQPLIIRDDGEAKKRAFFETLFTRTILEGIVAKKKVAFVEDCNVCRYRNGQRESLNGQGVVKPPQLKDLLDKKKATVQFHQPQRFQDSVWKLLEQLESYFGCLVGSNVYMTPKDSQGLAPHYDDVEVLVLQLEGEKRWRLYKPPISLPRDYSRDLDQSEIGKPTHDIVLKAGDVMYFPRGTVHQAETPSTCSHSTHLTISTYQRSAWGDLLGLALPSILRTAIEETDLLRQGFPLRCTYDHGSDTGTTIEAKLKDLIPHLALHVGSHVQEASNQMTFEFIANRLPPYCADTSPSGPMPSLKHMVRFRFPSHTFVLRRRLGSDEENEEDEEEEEEEEEEDTEEEDDKEEGSYRLFVYHSLHNARHEHMMSSEPKPPQGIMFPRECESALKALHKSPGWLRVRDINEVEDDVRQQMLTALWVEGLLEVKDDGDD